MIRLLFLSIALCTASACASPASTLKHSWKNPDLHESAPKRVIVLAKVTEPEQRKKLEDDTVAALASEGVDAVAAYSTVAPADMASQDVFVRKLDTLGIDALVLYEVGEQHGEVHNAPSVGVGVGVPVDVGFFDLFVGGSVPLFGGAQAENHVDVEAKYFRRKVQGDVWNAKFDLNLSQGTDEVSASLAGQVAEQLKESELL